MLTATILPSPSLFPDKFYERVERLEDTYFRPLLTLDSEHLIDYIDKNREKFVRDYGELLVELLRDIGLERLKEFTKSSSLMIIKDVRSKDLPKEIVKPLIEAVKLEVENELLMIKLLTREPKASLILNALFTDERSIRSSYYVIFSLIATLYLIDRFSPQQYDKAVKLAKLTLKSAEEKDAIVETFYIMLFPEREETLKKAIKEEGELFRSHEELERWLLQG